MRPLPLTALLVVALTLSGCIGLSPAGTTPADPTPTNTTPADATADNTVPYADLSPEAQRAFDAARNETVVLGPDSPSVDADFDWSVTDAFFVSTGESRYVRKNDTYYEVTLSGAGGVATYDITAERADDANESAVVAYESLPPKVSDEVRWAIENGSYRTPYGQWASLPASLRPGEYVRYEGTVYAMTYGVGDAQLAELRVREA